MEWNPTPPEHTVESDTVIWRYMDLPRFISMLSTSLWFTRAADFRDDPFEGFCDARHREFPVDEHGAGPLSRIGSTTVSLERMFAEGSYSNAEILQKCAGLSLRELVVSRKRVDGHVAGMSGRS